MSARCRNRGVRLRPEDVARRASESPARLKETAMKDSTVSLDFDVACIAFLVMLVIGTLAFLVGRVA
jgi:hypothetical protein